MALYVNYGCGFSAPPNWLNYDASPSLFIQNNYLLNLLVGRFLRTKFPDNVKFGNILKGLPGLQENSCRGIYCSHVLEHFSLDDLRTALKETYIILQPGGIFRCVVPDLEYYSRKYLKSFDAGDSAASITFLNEILLGQHKGHKNLRDIVVSLFISDQHLWMWDSLSLKKEIENAGFINIRVCQYNDCEDAHFISVEEKQRFQNAVALECRKPFANSQFS